MIEIIYFSTLVVSDVLGGISTSSCAAMCNCEETHVIPHFIPLPGTIMFVEVAHAAVIKSSSAITLSVRHACYRVRGGVNGPSFFLNAFPTKHEHIR